MHNEVVQLRDTQISALRQSDLTIEEIAEMVGLSRQSVVNSLSRTRARAEGIGVGTQLTELVESLRHEVMRLREDIKLRVDPLRIDVDYLLDEHYSMCIPSDTDTLPAGPLAHDDDDTLWEPFLGNP